MKTAQMLDALGIELPVPHRFSPFFYHLLKTFYLVANFLNACDQKTFIIKSLVICLYLPRKEYMKSHKLLLF